MALIFYFLILRLSGGCGGNIYFYFLCQNRGATALQMGVWGAKKFLLLYFDVSIGVRELRKKGRRGFISIFCPIRGDPSSGK